MTLSKVDASSQANSSLPLSLSPYLFSHSFVINTKKLRKAKQNLEATKNPVVVMDSLPYGADTGDTLPLAPHELDSLAESFDAEEPEFPSPPPLVSR